jgi:hypothetical protein
MWVVFDDAPLPGATPLSLYDHGRWDARLLAARGRVVCVCFNEAEQPLVLARPGRLTDRAKTSWADTMRRIGHDYVLLELKPGEAEVNSLLEALEVLGAGNDFAPTLASATVVNLMKTK